jgi:hypothetical protein
MTELRWSIEVAIELLPYKKEKPHTDTHSGEVM